MSPVRPEHTAGRDLPESRPAAGLPVLIRPVVEGFIPEPRSGGTEHRLLGHQRYPGGLPRAWAKRRVTRGTRTGRHQVAERGGRHATLDRLAAGGREEWRPWETPGRNPSPIRRRQRTVRFGVRLTVRPSDSHLKIIRQGAARAASPICPRKPRKPREAQLRLESGAKSFLEYRTKRHAHEVRRRSRGRRRGRGRGPGRGRGRG